MTDFVYMNLSDERATAGPLFAGADSIQKSFILSPGAGYRMLGSAEEGIDVLGGIRFWHINGELKLRPGILNGIDLSSSRNWVDGVFGMKGKKKLTRSWNVSGYGDIGGGGSNLTYEIIGAAGARIGERYSLVFGYRYFERQL